MVPKLFVARLNQTFKVKVNHKIELYTACRSKHIHLSLKKSYKCMIRLEF